MHIISFSFITYQVLMLDSTTHCIYWLKHYPVDKWISNWETNCTIHWIVFYLVDSATQRLNPGQDHMFKTITEFNKMLILIMQASSYGCLWLIAKHQRGTQACYANVLIIL